MTGFEEVKEDTRVLQAIESLVSNLRENNNHCDANKVHKGFAKEEILLFDYQINFITLKDDLYHGRDITKRIKNTFLDGVYAASLPD